MAKRSNSTKQFKVFLSHRYKAPAANLYFWSILSKVADVQFEIDPALMPDGTRKPTSVTRLEMLIRECDAFVGIFSLPEDFEASRLKSDTAYFRLETDLAMRSRKPTILFIDRRCQQLFRLPKAIRVAWFNQQEIGALGISPSRERFEKICRDFFLEVGASKSHRLYQNDSIDAHGVAVIVSSQEINSPYTSSVIDDVCSAIVQQGYASPAILRYPSSEAAFQIADCDNWSWCLADVGKGLYGTGLVGYLHGRFMPMIRALCSGGRGADTIAEYRSLYVGIEKGYDSDLIKWEAGTDLIQALINRLNVIQLESRLIANSIAARAYFLEASLRKEAIFLSYAGKDRDLATNISAKLRTRFQSVFDYREKDSIPTGKYWPAEIEKAINGSELAVQLISKSYFESPHCQREGMLLDQRKIEGHMYVCKIKLRDEEIPQMPESQRLEQYMRLWQEPTLDTLIDRIVAAFENSTRQQPFVEEPRRAADKADGMSK